MFSPTSYGLAKLPGGTLSLLKTYLRGVRVEEDEHLLLNSVLNTQHPDQKQSGISCNRVLQPSAALFLLGKFASKCLIRREHHFPSQLTAQGKQLLCSFPSLSRQNKRQRKGKKRELYQS